MKALMKALMKVLMNSHADSVASNTRLAEGSCSCGSRDLVGGKVAWRKDGA